MIQACDLKSGYELYGEEYENKAIEILRSGWYVLGRELSSFESEFASYIGTKHCVGVASGLDSLVLAFRALGIGRGDQVIVPANTYIASIMGVTINGATPVFVEPDDYFSINADLIEKYINKHTRALLVVHLYGMVCDMETVCKLCDKYDLKLIEDCAQSHGAMFDGQKTGSFGDVGCFSFYPTKNLGAFGDGGAITTNSQELSDKLRILRNYGSEKKYYFSEIGVNSRLDELQAGLLRIKLSHMEDLIRNRGHIADRYIEGLKGTSLSLPGVREKTRPVWHQFVVRSENRDEIITRLKERGIGTQIHYPIPPHCSEAYKSLNIKKGSLPITEEYARTVFSLPMYDGLDDSGVDSVIDELLKIIGD